MSLSLPPHLLGLLLIPAPPPPVPLTRHSRLVYPNASGGRCRAGSLHARRQWTPSWSVGSAYDDGNLSVQSHPAFGAQDRNTVWGAYGKYADLSHLRIIGASVFVHIKDANKLCHTHGKERFAASARMRATHSVSTLRRVELYKARTSPSSKHHHTCLPLPGSLRRYRIWTLRRLTSAATASTATTLHAKT